MTAPSPVLDAMLAARGRMEVRAGHRVDVWRAVLPARLFCDLRTEIHRSGAIREVWSGGKLHVLGIEIEPHLGTLAYVEALTQAIDGTRELVAALPLG